MTIPLLFVVSAIIYGVVRQTGDQSVTLPVAQQEEPSPAGESTQPGDDSENLETNAAAVMNDDQASPDEDVSLPEEAPPTPLPGETEDVTSGLTRSSDGYTMIVGSTFDLEAAKQELTRYADLGFITGVLTYDDEGVARLRMAVGQYETAEEADSMITALGDQLPEGSWARRIR